MKSATIAGFSLKSLIIVGLWSVLGAALQAAPKAPAAAYRGAITVDASSGKVLFEDKADTVSPPASVTKLMTFLVVNDRIKSGQLSLATEVLITAEDAAIGGTQVWLEAGEKFTVEDLLYAMMIQSANDCAHALARAAGGSRVTFVGMMNERAKNLGMNKTVFRTPHGLPPSTRKDADGDLTTPRDLALLSRELLLHTNVLRYTTEKERVFRPGKNVRGQVVMRNHNYLVERVRGVDGLKTGYTAGAGFCLAATAERDGRRVIVVTMGSPDQKTRNLKVAELIERGFLDLPADSRFYSAANPIRPVNVGASPIITPVISPSSPVAGAPAAVSTRPVPVHASPKKDESEPPSVRFVPKR